MHQSGSNLINAFPSLGPKYTSFGPKYIRLQNIGVQGILKSGSRGDDNSSNRPSLGPIFLKVGFQNLYVLRIRAELT